MTALPTNDAPRELEWQTCRLLVPLDQIAYVVAILEGYDNDFLVRTETRGLGFLRIWYPVDRRPLFDEILIEFAAEFDARALEYLPGMDGLEEIYPE